MTDDRVSPPSDGVPPESDGAQDEREGDLFAVRLTVTAEVARALTARTDLDFGDRPHFTRQPEGTASLGLFATRAQIDDLRVQGHPLELGENVSAAGRQRQAEVGGGDRFEGGLVLPRGLGRKIGGRQTARLPGQGGSGTPR